MGNVSGEEMLEKKDTSLQRGKTTQGREHIPLGR